MSKKDSFNPVYLTDARSPRDRGLAPTLRKRLLRPPPLDPRSVAQSPGTPPNDPVFVQEYVLSPRRPTPPAPSSLIQIP